MNVALAPSFDDLQTFLLDRLAATLGVSADELDAGEPFTSYGLDSMAAVTLAAELESLVGRKLPSTLLWDHPTVNDLAQHLAGATR